MLVTEESLLVIRGLGIQTSTSSNTYLSKATTRFIPTAEIQDIVIHEAFKGFEVRFYLAVIVEGERNVVVVFPVSIPAHVCRAILTTYRIYYRGEQFWRKFGEALGIVCTMRNELLIQQQGYINLIAASRRYVQIVYIILEMLLDSFSASPQAIWRSGPPQYPSSSSAKPAHICPLT